MKNALKNLELLLSKNLSVRDFRQEIRFWHNCFIIVQSMPGATKKFKTIADESDVQQLLDTLTEIKFAVIFDQLGFQVEFEPPLKDSSVSSRPDLRITRDDHSSIVEVKRFRAPGPHSPGQRMTRLPEEVPSDYTFPEFGDGKKDLQKIFNEIEKKFRQAGHEGIIAIWNSNDELSPYEFQTAAYNHKTSDRNNTASFMIVRADPWEKFLSADLCKDVASIHQRWKSDFENIVPDKILQNILLQERSKRKSSS